MTHSQYPSTGHLRILYRVNSRKMELIDLPESLSSDSETENIYCGFANLIGV